MSYYQTAKRTNLNKRNAQILHSIKRARERYGLELSVADIESIAKIIRKQVTKRVKVLSNSRVVHELKYKGKTMQVIYDKKRHTLVTVLPKDPATDHHIHNTKTEDKLSIGADYGN